MQHKIVEIIEFLISEIDRVPEPGLPDINSISKKLLDRGYTEKDIQLAVEWIVDLMDHSDSPGLNEECFNGKTENLRILNPFEKKIFSNEAHGFLLQLQALGIVSLSQLEQIIDRCMMLGMEKVDVEDVKIILTYILLGKKTGYSESDSFFYPGSETIQ